MRDGPQADTSYRSEFAEDMGTVRSSFRFRRQKAEKYDIAQVICIKMVAFFWPNPCNNDIAACIVYIEAPTTKSLPASKCL